MDAALHWLFSLALYLQTPILLGLVMAVWLAGASALHPLLFSIKVERSNLVVRLFHLIPIYDCYLRNIGAVRTGGFFTRPWVARGYRHGIWPFGWLKITFKERSEGEVLVFTPNPGKLRGEIEAFQTRG